MARPYRIVPEPEQREEVAARLGSPLGTRLAALSLILSGVFFVLYPALRPFSDEVSLSGAAAFASPYWVLAHSLAILGFVLLALGLLDLTVEVIGSRTSALAVTALVLTWIGVGLTLPYYGAEVFGLHAVGQEAITRNDASILTMVNAIRWEQGIWFILTGLLILAAGTILFAVVIWRSSYSPRWSGIPLAVAFALFIPQFTTPQPVRVAYGLLTMVGCFLVAWSLWKGPETRLQPNAQDPAGARRHR